MGDGRFTCKSFQIAPIGLFQGVGAKKMPYGGKKIPPTIFPNFLRLKSVLLLEVQRRKV